MSAPETKAFPPAPRNTRTRTSSSRAKVSKISAIASRITSDMALRRSGLLKIIQPMPLSLVAIILSVLSCIGRLPFGFFWRFSDCTGCAQALELVTCDTDLAEDLFRVFARFRACVAEEGGLLGTGDVDRLADDGKPAEALAVDVADRFEMLHLRI